MSDELARCNIMGRYITFSVLYIGCKICLLRNILNPYAECSIYFVTKFQETKLCIMYHFFRFSKFKFSDYVYNILIKSIYLQLYSPLLDLDRFSRFLIFLHSW
jgi:hypothetical protein